MRRLLLMLCLIGLAAPTGAQEWRMAPEYDVLLASYDIEPKVIRLAAGKPVRLRFVNNSNEGHDFYARSFFGAAQLRQRDRQVIDDGIVRVGAMETRTIVLVPKAGRYRMRSGNLLRRLLGMTGTIIVE